MGFGRGKVKRSRHAPVAIAVAALALAGCSSEERKNLPRPPVPNSVSVQVSPKRVDISPKLIGKGPVRRQQVIEDEKDGIIQTDSHGPLPVKMTITNATARKVKVEVIGPARRISPVVTPGGTGVLMTRLPTGSYRVRVAGRVGGGDQLVVGPDRSSPQNDLLLP